MAAPPPAPSATRTTKLTHWFWFNVFFALMPFVIDALIKPPQNAAGQPVSFLNSFLLKREVFIVCTAIAADAFGSLFLSLDRIQSLAVRINLVGSCFAIGVVTSALYVIAPQSPLTTLLVFSFTLVVAMVCKSVA